MEASLIFTSVALIVGLISVFGFYYFIKKNKNKLPPTDTRPQLKTPIKAAEEKKVDLKEESKEESKEEANEEAKEESKRQIQSPPSIPWNERLKKGLSRSRNEVWKKMESIFSMENKNKLSAEDLEALEEILYGADITPALVQEMLDHLQKMPKENLMNYKTELYDFLLRKLNDPIIQEKRAHFAELFDVSKKVIDEASPKAPRVIMVVGINGAGKTTTIGKLATKLTRQGASVVVGACDTFRAAAVDQLQVWCERSGAHMVRAKEGSDPSGVGYEALKKAHELGSDYCLLDTAGRIHTNENLMEELKKGKRVLQKLNPKAPHHILIVLDAVTGQNALKQAKEFHRALELSGLIFTKCDGSSKAGSGISIIHELKIPICYIGVGEDVDDLNEFHSEDYLKALLEI
jgi:fused signal recognition particle receptor